MAGWGEVEEKVRPTFLKEANVSIWDQGRCEDISISESQRDLSQKLFVLDYPLPWVR